MTLEEVQLIAFQLIANAGEAFDNYYSAIIKAQDNEFEEADRLLSEGDQKMTDAHKAQTKLLQAENNKENIPYSLIMTHAQDHLTTAINWERFAKVLIRGMKKDEEKK